METQLDMPIFLGLPWQIQLAWTLKQTSEEYDEDDFFRAKYVHSTNVDEPVRMERPESPHTNTAYPRQEFYFHRDRLGNITEITNLEGTVVQSYVYDAFGSVTIYDKDGSEITPSNSNYLETPYAFTGRELDPETGLYFYRARYYDPNLGRFLSEDPIEGNSERLNLYQYVENNPLNSIDPTGEILVAPIVIGALTGAGIEAASQILSGQASECGLDFSAIAREAVFGAFSGGIFGNIGRLGKIGRFLGKGGQKVAKRTVFRKGGSLNRGRIRVGIGKGPQRTNSAVFRVGLPGNKNKINLIDLGSDIYR